MSIEDLTDLEQINKSYNENKSENEDEDVKINEEKKNENNDENELKENNDSKKDENEKEEVTTNEINENIQSNQIQKKEKPKKEDKSNQTFDSKEQQIEYLQRQIDELTKENNNLKNINEKNEKQIEDDKLLLISKEEVETIFENAKSQNIIELENKINTMKSMVKELNQEFENQIKKKDDKFKEKTQSIIKQLDEYNKKESNYINQIETLNNQLKDYQNQVNNYIKERTTMEDIIIRQEEKLNILVDKVNKVEEVIKRKNRILKENEAYAIELIKIVEQQKTQINQFKNNNRLYEKNYYPNNYSNYSNFNHYKSKTNNLNLDYDDKTNFNYQSMDNIHEDKNVVLPLINNSYNKPNLIDYNKDKVIMENDEMQQNEKNLEEFKNMMDQLIDDIEK